MFCVYLGEPAVPGEGALQLVSVGDTRGSNVCQGQLLGGAGED